MSFLGAISQAFTPSRRASGSRPADQPAYEEDHLLATFMTAWEEIKVRQARCSMHCRLRK